jgi:hypothetical protein
MTENIPPTTKTPMTTHESAPMYYLLFAILQA